MRILIIWRDTSDTFCEEVQILLNNILLFILQHYNLLFSSHQTLLLWNCCLAWKCYYSRQLRQPATGVVNVLRDRKTTTNLILQREGLFTLRRSNELWWFVSSSDFYSVFVKMNKLSMLTFGLSWGNRTVFVETIQKVGPVLSWVPPDVASWADDSPTVWMQTAAPLPDSCVYLMA